jgi:hypothetical protein
VRGEEAWTGNDMSIEAATAHVGGQLRAGPKTLDLLTRYLTAEPCVTAEPCADAMTSGVSAFPEANAWVHSGSPRKRRMVPMSTDEPDREREPPEPESLPDEEGVTAPEPETLPEEPDVTPPEPEGELV